MEKVCKDGQYGEGPSLRRNWKEEQIQGGNHEGRRGKNKMLLGSEQGYQGSGDRLEASARQEKSKWIE